MIIFLVAACGALYVTCIYPLLLRYWAKWYPRPVRRQRIQPSVSVIIAVYNGELFLANKLRSVLALDYPRDLLEIIVASDGSTDRTESIAESFASQKVRLVRVPRGGKPAALNAAIPLATGEILVLTDVRQELDPNGVSYLVEAFADPTIGVVSGDLIVRDPTTHKEASIGLYRNFESWLRDNLGSIDSIFGATGAFYAIRRQLAVPIPPEILLDDMYLPLSAFFRGYRLIFDSRARAYDLPTSLNTEFHRKVRTLAGNYQVIKAYPALLGPQNRMWIHFLSYKVGRLVLPWFLILIGISSFWLPRPLAVLSLGAQAVVYSLALLDPYLAEQSPLKRISSPVRTFAAMMFAAIRAMGIFFVPAQSLWRVTAIPGQPLQGRAKTDDGVASISREAGKL